MRRLLCAGVFLSCLGFWGPEATFAQNQSSSRQAQKAYEKAREQLDLRSMEGAAAALEEAVTHDPGFIAAHQQLGDLHRRQKNYAHAKASYLRVIALNPEFNSHTYFGLGESELFTGDYQNALVHFDKYLKYQNITSESRKRAEKYRRDCMFSIEALQRPVPFKPLNLGTTINSNHDEYLPTLTADEQSLIYTRRANNNEDFYASSKMAGQWSTGAPLSPAINTAQFNEGGQTISPDGRYLFFTGCNRPDGLGRCDIYLSHWDGTSWSEPFNPGGPVNSPAWESQPSISADGKTLFFSSNRNGGKGGYDIWKSELLQDGTWTTPVNLSDINTEYDEVSPFIHPDDQTLYFASDGWPGLGARDLFVSRLDNSGKWSLPANLGYPINTHKEETGLTVNLAGNRAYYASDQAGSHGGLDIYSFEMHPSGRPTPVGFIAGIVIGADSRKALGAEVSVVNTRTKAVVFEDRADPTTGNFLVSLMPGSSYAVNVSHPGYLISSTNLNIIDEGRLPADTLQILLQPIRAGQVAVLNNIFFNTDSYELLPESETELNELVQFMRTNPGLQIEIGGHTDDAGETKYNLRLSASRANAVREYLVKHEISLSRMNTRGYGESIPVADNTTEEGRRLNRRTEIRIIGM